MKPWQKWVVGLVIVLETILLAHFYAQYHLARVATGNVLGMVNGQCQEILTRQGFTVERPKPPQEEPEPKEEK